MRLTLRLPGLLLPRQAMLDTASGLDLPGLSLLLGRGRLRREGPQTYGEGLAREWGMGSLPAAALRLLGEGGEPGGDCWICLDPVHLQVHRRGVTLGEPATLALSAEEDEALRAALSPLFADFGALTASSPGHWHVRLASQPDIVTDMLPDAVGRAVDPALPAGGDGPRWRHCLAHAQMELRRHPVNRARESAGRPEINSLWPWGPGCLASPAARFDRVWSADPVLRGLALAARVAVDAPPPAFRTAAGNVLAALDDLAIPARNLDAVGWVEALERLERDWFAPALGALRSGRCKSLRVRAYGTEASLAIDIGRIDLLKAWRRPSPLARLAA